MRSTKKSANSPQKTTEAKLLQNLASQRKAADDALFSHLNQQGFSNQKIQAVNNYIKAYEKVRDNPNKSNEQNHNKTVDKLQKEFPKTDQKTRDLLKQFISAKDAVYHTRRDAEYKERMPELKSKSASDASNLERNHIREMIGYPDLKNPNPYGANRADNSRAIVNLAIRNDNAAKKELLAALGGKKSDFKMALKSQRALAAYINKPTDSNRKALSKAIAKFQSDANPKAQDAFKNFMTASANKLHYVQKPMKSFAANASDLLKDSQALSKSANEKISKHESAIGKPAESKAALESAISDKEKMVKTLESAAKNMRNQINNSSNRSKNISLEKNISHLLFRAANAREQIASHKIQAGLMQKQIDENAKYQPAKATPAPVAPKIEVTAKTKPTPIPAPRSEAKAKPIPAPRSEAKAKPIPAPRSEAKEKPIPAPRSDAKEKPIPSPRSEATAIPRPSPRPTPAPRDDKDKMEDKARNLSRSINQSRLELIKTAEGSQDRMKELYHNANVLLNHAGQELRAVAAAMKEKTSNAYPATIHVAKDNYENASKFRDLAKGQLALSLGSKSDNEINSITKGIEANARNNGKIIPEKNTTSSAAPAAPKPTSDYKVDLNNPPPSLVTPPIKTAKTSEPEPKPEPSSPRPGR
jgi:hypothetical protein